MPPTPPSVTDALLQRARTFQHMAKTAVPRGMARDDYIGVESDPQGWMSKVEVHLGAPRIGARDFEQRFHQVLLRARDRALAAAAPGLVTHSYDADTPVDDPTLWTVVSDSPAPPSVLRTPDIDSFLAELRSTQTQNFSFLQEQFEISAPLSSEPAPPHPLIRHVTGVTFGPITVVIGPAGGPEGIRVSTGLAEFTSIDLAEAIITAQQVTISQAQKEQSR